MWNYPLYIPLLVLISSDDFDMFHTVVTRCSSAWNSRFRWNGFSELCQCAMDPAAVEEFRKLEQEKNRLEGEIKNLYEYLTEDGCLADLVSFRVSWEAQLLKLQIWAQHVERMTRYDQCEMGRPGETGDPL